MCVCVCLCVFVWVYVVLFFISASLPCLQYADEQEERVTDTVVLDDWVSLVVKLTNNDATARNNVVLNPSVRVRVQQ